MSKFKVYIAAASSEIERVDHWTKRLEDAGIEVISTWPASVRAVGESNPCDASKDERRALALGCLREVMGAHVVWLLIPSVGHETRGAWAEFGVAWVWLARPAIISSGDTKQTIFTALGSEHDLDADAFLEIVGLAARRAG